MLNAGASIKLITIKDDQYYCYTCVDNLTLVRFSGP